MPSSLVMCEVCQRSTIPFRKKGIVLPYILVLLIDQEVRMTCPWKKGLMPQKTVFVAFCAKIGLQAAVKRLGQIRKLSAKKG